MSEERSNLIGEIGATGFPVRSGRWDFLISGKVEHFTWASFDHNPTEEELQKAKDEARRGWG